MPRHEGRGHPRRMRREWIRREGSSSLFLPLLLQTREEMACAVDLVPMFADGLGGAIHPAALLGGFPVGQAPGLRFAL